MAQTAVPTPELHGYAARTSSRNLSIRRPREQCGVSADHRGVRGGVSDSGKLVGRVLSERYRTAHSRVTSRVVISEPAANGLATVINMQAVRDVISTRADFAGQF